MFASRRRATSNPASKAPPSASASLAATKAFLRDRESNASLSSAAAAAALRTHPSGPTQVGDTVTKRMVRKGSVSSQGSGSQRPQDLRRHSSSGSMTERSFRAPSPSRSSPVDPAAPPVPAVPREISGASPVHRRASSLDPPFRGGSPMGRGGGRGVSLDRGVAASTPAPGRGQPRIVSLAQVPEDEPNASPRSVNFSRPMSPQQATSPPKPVASARAGQSGWFGGPVVNPDQTFRGSKPQQKASAPLSAFEAHSVQQGVQNAADRPVSTKKMQIAHGVEGARLAAGGMRAKPTGTSVQSRQHQPAPSTHHAHRPEPRVVDPNSPYAIYDPSTRTFIHKQDAMALHRALSDAQDPVPPYESHQAPAPQYEAAPQQRRTEQQPPPRLASPVHIDMQARPRATRQQVEEPAGTFVQTQGQAVEARPPTPPASHHSMGSTLARQKSEDFADADIRPSLDTDVSRGLEMSVAEEEQTHYQHSPVVAVNQDSAYPHLGALEPKRQASVRSERTNSLSPPRNAHFAPVAVELPNGVRHQPPPRSVSPAKSALKPSPSVSRRGSSPIANDGRVFSQATSEVSDAASDDAIKKKKRQVRVSFDEDPVIAGTSAYADIETPTSPTGLSASRWSTASDEQDVDDDFMKPRPVLPSFGSIRDKGRGSREGEVPEKVTETVSSSLSASTTSASGPTESSNDHAIGGILAQDFALKQAHQPSQQEPLPPEVTSVEGSGYVSDESSSSSDIELIASPPEAVGQTLEPARSTPEPEPKTLTTEVESRSPPPEVPAIAVQPASPSPVERAEPKFPRPYVPGGWDDDEGSDTGSEGTAVPQAKPEPAIVPDSTIQVPALQPANEESSDDNSSIYSDAYEDLSENEDEGFGSIDAVVERPVVSPAPGLKSSKFANLSAEEPPKSGLQHETRDNNQVSQDPKATDEWDVARQHWTTVNGSRKQHGQSEPSVDQPVATARDVDATKHPLADRVESSAKQKASLETTAGMPKSKTTPKSPQPSAKPRKSAMKKTTAVPQPTIPSEPQLRKTMREGTAPRSVASPEPRMRKSMRDGSITNTSSAEPHLRKSMRSDDRQGTMGLASSRYSMPPLETKPPKGALQKRHIPAAAAASSATKPRPQSVGLPLTKPIVPTPTYDSDSDVSASSFQRQRPRASRKEGGRYTMRGSMRSGPAPTMRATPTMRPMSPPQATSPPPALRKSMRPTSPTVERPSSSGLKSSRFSIRSLSPAGRFRTKSTADIPPLPTQTIPPKKTKMPTFGKSSKPKVTPTEPSRSRFKSRFADSSDEDDDRPQRFQSRFADSDDDDDVFELPPGLAPVRGIPKRPGEEDGDSTDLEDEDSDAEASREVNSKNAEIASVPTTNGKTNGQGVSFSAGSLRQSKHAAELPAIEAGKKAKPKRGFFGMGKKKTPTSYVDDTDTARRNEASAEIPMPPEHRSRDPSRPLTPIGEDKDIEAGGTARSPKLQRRNMPQWARSTSDSWPLPQPPSIGEDTRPQSSDGIANRRSSLRPVLSKRNSSQVSEPRTTINSNTGKKVVLGSTGKKKKFQGLRRVFGLND